MQNVVGTFADQSSENRTNSVHDDSECTTDVRFGNENAASLAGEHGVNSTGAAVTSLNFDYHKRNQRAKALCDAVFAAERDDALHIMAVAFDMLRTGTPVEPLFSYADEAKNWASLASSAELKNYLLACWKKLPPQDRSAFLAFVGRRATA